MAIWNGPWAVSRIARWWPRELPVHGQQICPPGCGGVGHGRAGRLAHRGDSLAGEGFGEPDGLAAGLADVRMVQETVAVAVARVLGMSSSNPAGCRFEDTAIDRGCPGRAVDRLARHAPIDLSGTRGTVIATNFPARATSLPLFWISSPAMRLPSSCTRLLVTHDHARAHILPTDEMASSSSRRSTSTIWPSGIRWRCRACRRSRCCSLRCWSSASDR